MREVLTTSAREICSSNLWLLLDWDMVGLEVPEVLMVSKGHLVLLNGWEGRCWQ